MNNLNNIQDSGFKAPKDYFESLEDSIMHAIKEDEISEKVTASGMQPPKGYFENLENSILSKVLEEKSQPKVISLFSKQNLLYASSIAAALVIMLSVYFNQDDITFDTIDVELVENYILDQNIDSFELALLLKDDELATDTFIDSDLYGETLEDYLLENTDIEDLIIE